MKNTGITWNSQLTGWTQVSSASALVPVIPPCWSYPTVMISQ